MLVALATPVRPHTHATTMLEVFRTTLATSRDEGWPSSFSMSPRTQLCSRLSKKPRLDLVHCSHKLAGAPPRALSWSELRCVL
jgi:hypothetical protein